MVISKYYHCLRSNLTKRVAIVAILGALGCGSEASADTIAITADTSILANLANTGTIGWEFTPSLPIQVTKLGWFDGGSGGNNGNGLIEAHEIGIWDSGQNLLSSATVPAGTSGALEDEFRYVLVTPLSLSANQTYVVAGTHTFNVDLIISVLTTLVPAPQLVLGSGRIVNSGGGLQYPSSSTGPRFVGANFQFLVVPEPSTLTLAGLGLLGLLAYGWQRRRRA